MSSEKPLGKSAYGHIPHLSGSRMTPADKKCNPGHERIATIQKRDKHDIIIVQEKLDGSCCSVAKINGEIIPLTRAGYIANTSPYKQHHYFHDWVFKNKDRFYSILNEGERAVGEWLLQAHGTKYQLDHEPFVLFDIMEGIRRISWNELFPKAFNQGFIIPRTLHTGDSISIDEILPLLNKSGHGALDSVEGAIWRVERKGVLDFICKYVRPDKQDGIYLPGIGPNESEIWNVNPEEIL